MRKIGLNRGLRLKMNVFYNNFGVSLIKKIYRIDTLPLHIFWVPFFDAEQDRI